MMVLFFSLLFFFVHSRYQYVSWPSAPPPLPSTINGKTAIHLASFFPVSLFGQFFLLLTDLALQDINADPNLLPDYVVVMDVIGDSSDLTTTGGVATSLWLSSTYNKSLVGILGDLLSVTTIAEASVITVFQIPQVSPGATSMTLSDKSQYPYFLRLCGSEINQAYALVETIKKYGWTRVGTLNSQSTVFSQMIEIFYEQSITAGIKIIVAESFASGDHNSTPSQLDKINRSGAKIILLIMSSADVQGIFTQIQQSKNYSYLNGNDIVWIGVDSWIGIDIEADVSGVVGTVGALGPENPMKDRIKQRYNQSHPGQYWSSYHEWMYDSPWVYAHALHDIIYGNPVIQSTNFDVTLQFRNLLLKQMFNTSFSGISGRVVFDNNGDGKTRYSLLNNVNGTYVEASIWDSAQGTWTDLQPVVWRDGTTNIPTDRFLIQIIYISDGVRITFIVLASVSFLVPLFHLVMLIIYRDHPIILAAIPIFLMLILFATMIGLGTIFVISMDPSDGICVIPHWFAHLSFWIIFSCLFMKTARVWWLFRSAEKLKQSVITTRDTLVVTSGVVLLVVLYLAIWTGVAKMRAITV
eukprot:TRINITY_DN5039_c0_g1_i10.p1 TRINITY_DN5039_c0_g1~~TRINITY_DN5039_c0_g1_i10.p1  ORF type:complete len:581 (+),score=86.43 TRINITY_DN5039_c0_g1_i10:90-1832(+)